MTEVSGKVLRRGYTTGTCAAAAAKAAVEMLFQERDLCEVEVALPAGGTARLKIMERRIGEGGAWCAVVKDAGDDPDVTDGARICASARKLPRGIVVKGGRGVGVVTKKGLPIPVGEKAINPVPMAMIRGEVSKALPPGMGVEVEISVPEGERLAKRTLNEKLGIMGGISIIGTTGIVEPYSVDAFKRSLSPQIDIALAAGFDEPVLTPGRISERRAVEKGVPEDALVVMANHVGFILGECARKGVRRALLYGGPGKLAKLSAGHLNTHSSVGGPALEVISGKAGLLGVPEDVMEGVLGSSRAEEAALLLKKRGCGEVLDRIAEDAGARCSGHVGGSISIGVIIASGDGTVLGCNREARSSRWAGLLL
ncbi:MAG: cobalamin biosynthesis protein CbiD [Methanobacteriota archaeon]|nr:MAG: cobalamin biosynthesis protein CbiD [Euryarchaeota archaeon]